MDGSRAAAQRGGMWMLCGGWGTLVVEELGFPTTSALEDSMQEPAKYLTRACPTGMYLGPRTAWKGGWVLPSLGSSPDVAVLARPWWIPPGRDWQGPSPAALRALCNRQERVLAWVGVFKRQHLGSNRVDSEDGHGCCTGTEHVDECKTANQTDQLPSTCTTTTAAGSCR